MNKKIGRGVALISAVTLLLFALTACQAEKTLNLMTRGMELMNVVGQGVETGFRIAANIAYIKSLQNADQQKLADAYKAGVATSWTGQSGEYIAFTPVSRYRPDKRSYSETSPYIGSECMQSEIVSKKTAPDGTIVSTIVTADACFDTNSNQWVVVRGSEREEVMEAYVPKKKKRRLY
jgi:hypothetical protein